MTHKLKTAFVGIILLIAFTMLRVYDPYPIETLRLKGLDYYQRTQPKVISDNIQIILQSRNIQYIIYLLLEHMTIYEYKNEM